jgi:hypothetical protein
LRSVNSLSMLTLLSLAAYAHAETNVATTLIPFDSLSPTNRALVRSVTDHYTLRREYDAREFRARKQQVDYLMDHLDACSALAETVGLIQYRATGDVEGRYFADNHEGARGYIVEAYSSDGKRIYFVEGTERGLFNIEGRGVAVIDYAQTGTNTIRYTGAMFVKVDNVVIAALAQVFGIFLRGTVDRHFNHVLHHPIKLSEMALSDPQFLLEKIRQMPERDRVLLAPFAESLGTDTNNPAR